MSGMGRKGYKVYVSMSKEEHDAFIGAYKSTIYRNQSAYARKLLMGKPVKAIFRNRSLDDFIECGVGLRKDLKLILARNTLTDAEKEDLRRKLSAIEENLIQIVNQCSRK